MGKALPKNKQTLLFLWEGVDLSHLAQDRDQPWAMLDTVANPRVPQRPGISWLSEQPLTPEYGKYSMRLVS
jgi:hypothetical protein